MKLIPLTKGFFAKVSDEDHKRISQFKWCYHQGYAIRGVKRKGKTTLISMADFIVGGGEQKTVVDHKSLDTLDNQRKNLRHATHQQNIFNQPMHKDNSSGFKGVSWHKAAKKWQAGIGFNMKRIHLGLFDCKKAAYEAYKNAAKKLHGEFSRI